VIFALLLQAASTLPTDASALESALSALESDIKTLETSSIPLEHRLPWFTGIVALGVAMELWVIWHERRDDMEAWGRGIIRSPDRPSTVKFLVEIASVLLITGGIVGELWIGVNITSINGALRSDSAELRGKTGELIALLNVKAEGLRKDAGAEKTARLTLQGKVTAANGRVEELRKANNKAAADLEDEKKKRLKLAASLLPRDFWNQSGALAKLANVKPPSWVVFEYPDEHEVIRTAEQINFVLRLLPSPWRTGRRHGNEDQVSDGIRISVGHKFDPPSSSDLTNSMNFLRRVKFGDAKAAALKQSLLDSGIEAELANEAQDLPPEALLVRVGTKPNHALESAIKELGMPFTPHSTNPKDFFDPMGGAILHP
jgi:hypothetical protein